MNVRNLFWRSHRCAIFPGNCRWLDLGVMLLKVTLHLFEKRAGDVTVGTFVCLAAGLFLVIERLAEARFPQAICRNR